MLPPTQRLTRDDAETAHNWLLAAMSILESRRHLRLLLSNGQSEPDARLTQTLLDGVVFPSPFGIAAGFDKNATMVQALDAILQPGFVEVGTVTMQAQLGNARPRVVVIPRHGVFDAMGFPGDGIDVVLKRIEQLKFVRMPIGLNIGTMKSTPAQSSATECAALVRTTATLWLEHGLPDYYVMNVSSPNTPGLAALQKFEPLNEIVAAIVDELDSFSAGDPALRHRLLVKVGPELDRQDIESTVEIVVEHDIGGVVATNSTTIGLSNARKEGDGAYSGPAFYDRSSRIVRQIARLLPRDKLLIATGGIATVDRAFEMLRYADLIGGFTGLVFRGPGMFRELSEGVLARMDNLGVNALSQLREEERPG